MEYYSWRVRGKPVEVRLSLPMLQFMVPWIHNRAALAPDMYGILLGRSRRGWGRTIVFIDDFEPFDPATLRGAPRAPHGTELKVVGLYRRHNREELRLDQLDASLIQTSFVNRGMVYLLMVPTRDGPDRAAFFIQERGEVHGYSSYAEFPFDADFLREPALDAAMPKSRRWIPIAGLAACLLALAGWFVWLRQDAAAPVAATPAGQPAVVQPSPAPEPAKVKPQEPNPERGRTIKKHKASTTKRKRGH